MNRVVTLFLQTFVFLSFLCVTLVSTAFSYDAQDRKSVVFELLDTKEHPPNERSSLQDVISCENVDRLPWTKQHNNYWLLTNYIPARRSFYCWESITYTTHSDVASLHNLQALLPRWQGPVSVATYAPGSDFAPTLQYILWARKCMTYLVADLVTFHIYFDFENMPEYIPPAAKALSGPAPDCSKPPNVSFTERHETKNVLRYPINVGRNIAREAAETYYVFQSDIELYPSPGLIHDFLQMIRRNFPPLRRPPKVFPLAVFELVEGSSLPQTKSELIEMLRNNLAKTINEHDKFIGRSIPHETQWLEAELSPGLDVFRIENRTGSYSRWQPYYIGTIDDPTYDERLPREGVNDKVIPFYAMCVLGYEFHILDNAFLIRKPGVVSTTGSEEVKKIEETEVQAGNPIISDMKIIFGENSECVV